MAGSALPQGGRAGARCRLAAGLGVLDRWLETATQIEKNAVYKALFAIVDRSVFRRYGIFGDKDEPREFSVLVRSDLVITFRVHGFDSFGIVHIGSLPGVTIPGFGLAA